MRIDEKKESLENLRRETGEKLQKKKKKQILPIAFLNFFSIQIDIFHKILLLEVFLRSLRFEIKGKSNSKLNFELFLHAFGLTFKEYLGKKFRKDLFFIYLVFQNKNVSKPIKLLDEFSRKKLEVWKNLEETINFNKEKIKESKKTNSDYFIQEKDSFFMLELSGLKKKKRTLINKETLEIHNLVSENLVKLNSVLHSKVYEQIFFIEQVYDHSTENIRSLNQVKKNLFGGEKSVHPLFSLPKFFFFLLLIVLLVEIIN